MARYFLWIEYDGAPYCGFQAQDHHPSVQGTIEAAILAFCGERIRITAAGRTDTGVHASGQVVSLDLMRPYPPVVVLNALNAHMQTEPVSVRECARVGDDFSARFSATGRGYCYRILNRAAKPALAIGQVWHIKKNLELERMQEAASVLIGTHDFTTFRHVACQARSPVKSLDTITIEQINEEIHLRFAARSFLHRQVRSLTGSLVEVGLGRWTKDDLEAALLAKDRTRCGQVAPAQGLCLTAVSYEDTGNLEDLATRPEAAMRQLFNQLKAKQFHDDV